MNRPTVGGSWLTISDILTDLDVPEHEWREWQAAGQTPLSVVSTDGTERIRLAHYERWLDSLADDSTEEDE
ncbi:hypothetical protein ACFQ08_05905 [Streptosporangium algeriense]|uniref:Excisionase n=1 Tax=Streptosporangium algeriense TaxID=1682748 RepID=A0ABW3DJK1_9ACTN